MWYWIVGLSVAGVLATMFFSNAAKLNQDLGYDEWDTEPTEEDTNQ